jgi:hypothetical protein
MQIEKPITLDLLDTSAAPALSSASDVPIVETKPDATPAPVADKAEAVADKAETHSESATEPEKEPSANDEPQKAKGVQKRLDELTKRAREAEEREKRLLALLEKQSGAPAETQPSQEEAPAEDAAPVRPNKADYSDQEVYEQALEDYFDQKARFVARQELAAAQEEAEVKRRDEEVGQARQAVQSAYKERMEVTAAKYSDFKQVAESPDVIVSIPMAAAILHSENGPEVQYYLGKNPQEAQRIFNLAPPLQLIELGKIEARLTATPAPAPKPEVKAEPAPSVSKAPAPIKPISQGTQAAVSKDPGEMSMDEYAAWRKERDKSARARH